MTMRWHLRLSTILYVVPQTEYIDFFTRIYSMIHSHQSPVSGRQMYGHCQHAKQDMGSYKYVFLFLCFSTIFSSFTLSLVLHKLSVPNQGSRWQTIGFCLAHMKQRDMLIRSAVVGFTQHTSVALSHSCPFNFLPPSYSSLPAILSEACGNAARPGIEG